jgi:glutamine amidotransferase
MKSISLIHYDIGNLLSVQRAFEYLGVELDIAKNPDDIRRSQKLILPGVGAFASCIHELRVRKLVEPILEAVRENNPILGICVGMQMLFDESEEFGVHKGLGIIQGKVKSIPASSPNGQKRKIPHTGWSVLDMKQKCPLTEGVLPASSVYFVHSYSAYPEDENSRIADCNYHGETISAIVRKNNVFGTQFHPEKSGEVGLNILKNFIKM